MPIQEVVKRHPLTSTKVHHRAKNKQFSTLRCTKTGSTQPKLSAACFVVQSCLADADFVVFSNYCLIGTRPKPSFYYARFLFSIMFPLGFSFLFASFCFSFRPKRKEKEEVKRLTTSPRRTWRISCPPRLRPRSFRLSRPRR